MCSPSHSQLTRCAAKEDVCEAGAPASTACRHQPHSGLVQWRSQPPAAFAQWVRTHSVLPSTQVSWACVCRISII